MAEKKASKTKAKNKKKSVFSKIISFFRACIGECKKISWTTWQQTTKNFGIVLLVIVVCGLIIYGIDRGLYALLDLVMQTANN
ncbi:MAG: preprotein translocase subunit SecE [Oscillospiraceae bacterium]|nr:preprotein translocase subunit SecE [Oscillospiraceae bacterium]